jgi:DNA polymerase
VRTLAIDIETYSGTDLTKSGVYKYVQDPDFAILLFAYAFDDEAVQVVDLASGEELPIEVKNAICNPHYLKTAFNANFERSCIGKYFFGRNRLPASEWQCTMAKAAMLGLPLSLDAASRALKIEQTKDAAGKALIRYFSMPCKPTKSNGMRTRNLPTDAPEKWKAYKGYCKQDVVVELAIRRKIAFFQIPDMEKKLWCLDQRINDQGVLLDPVFVKNAISMDATFRERLTTQAVNLTGLFNPNSAAQLKAWLTAAMPETEVTTLKKEDIPVLLKASTSYVVTRVLQIRQEMAKTSIKKYTAMLKGMCADSRVRGLLQYYGANRTGRWAGRLVQVQNLPQNHLPDLDLARQLVKENDLELLEMLFGNVPDTLSQLIRTSFVAPHGHKFIIADFSAIEARVIAWLAGERWRMEVFATHGKIYEASAAHMFKVPLESIVKGSDLRQKGKVAELALGYQGGPNALIAMGALKMGLQEDELPKLVSMWRNANKAIVALWEKVDDAALAAVDEPGSVHTIAHGIWFVVQKGSLWIELPSKRRLAYLNPRLRSNRFGNMAITYEGMSQTTKQWAFQETYGGKLVENIVQAIARDCLADAMLRVDDAGYKVVMHVHDEIVAEVPVEQDCIEDINRIMSTPIAWAKGLLLRADSYESLYYKKD